jgi:hypothetical protein
MCLVPLSWQDLAFARASRRGHPDKRVQRRIGAAFFDELSELRREEKAIASGWLFSLRHNTHWTAIILASFDREIEDAVQNGACWLTLEAANPSLSSSVKNASMTLEKSPPPEIIQLIVSKIVALKRPYLHYR